MPKSFKDFMTEIKERKSEKNEQDYSQWEDDRLIRQFNEAYLSKAGITKFANMLGSVLAIRFHQRIKRERDVAKKVDLMADLTLAGLAAIADKLEDGR